VWDMWPIQEEDGSTTSVGDAELWMALSAPADGHPESRHDLASIRMLARAGSGWADLGTVFDAGESLGSREWSGSAVHRGDGTVSVFYTAAGLRASARPTFHQRVVEVRRHLVSEPTHLPASTDTRHREVLRPDSQVYLPANESTGGPGRIRAFRDPFWFRDPTSGAEHLLVAASVPGGARFAGAVAYARATAEGWVLLPPLLVTDGIAHEIERPHLVVRDSLYYLFFTATRQSFHPSGSAPTGLFGFVAPALTGPYEPLNDSGLVIQNPPEFPDQAYGWLVLPSLEVHSFVNYRTTGGADPRHAAADVARSNFGGTFAPVLGLSIAGASTRVAPAGDQRAVAGRR
jgi:levansucrase